jgi:hypothetical protein
MKAYAATLAAAMHAGFAAMLHAAVLDDGYLARCKSEVGQRYGADHEIKLVGVRRAGTGVTVKLAVRLDDAATGRERVEFTSCRLSREEVPALATEPIPGKPEVEGGTAAARNRD